MAKGDDIQERLIDFAVSMIQFCSELPKTQAGRHVAGQLIRSGTSAAPNYAEARAAESTKDFVHKLKIALKELNETKIWLQICKKGKLTKHDGVIHVSNECDELCKIISTSIKTVVANNRKP